MIEFNFTIVIQALNFLIAWFMIDKLLLRIAVAEVQEEDALKVRLQNSVNKEQRALAKTVQEQKDAWKTYEQQFLQETPEIPQDVLVADVPPKKCLLQDISEQEEQDLVSRAAQFLTEEASRV